MTSNLEMESLFGFWYFINMSLTYLLRHLLTYIQPRDPHVANFHNIYRWVEIHVN